jgi:hypothetical protein
MGPRGWNGSAEDFKRSPFHLGAVLAWIRFEEKLTVMFSVEVAEKEQDETLFVAGKA